MNVWFVVALAMMALGLAAYLVGRRMADAEAPNRDDYSDAREYRRAVEHWEDAEAPARGARIFGRIALACGALVVALSSFQIVPTNTISIVTSFGRPVDAVGNGWDWKQPWQKTVEFDASRQYLRFEGKGNDKKPSEDGKTWPVIPVKMKNEAKADVSVTVGWQMKAGTRAEKDQAIELFKSFKTFDRLTENFMKANAQSAAQETWKSVNPLVEGENPDLGILTGQMLNNVRSLVGSEIEIVSVQITGIDYDDNTDKAIANMQAEFAKTQLAIQQEKTNEQISKANAKLVNSLSELILQDACVKGAIAAGQNPGPCLQPGWGSAGTAPAPTAAK